MLSDPLTLKYLDLSSHTTVSVGSVGSFATVDVSPGKSVRQASGNGITAGPATLTIAHSVSNENKPAKTDRSLVRLDLLCKDALGREMTMFAYTVFGVPRDARTYSSDLDPVASVYLAQAMAGILCGITATALDESRVTRILAGEP